MGQRHFVTFSLEWYWLPFVAELEPLSSAAPSGTADRKWRIQRIWEGASISSLMFSCPLSRENCSGVGWAALGCSVVSTREMAKGFLCLCQESCRYDQGKGSGRGMRSLVWHCLLFSIPFCAVRVSGSDNSWHAVLNWEVQLAVRFLFNRNELDERLKNLGGDTKLSRTINSEGAGKNF